MSWAHEKVALLVAAAFFAGLIDAIAGGGGLITVPALLGGGLSPHAVLATNKGQACFGAAASLGTYMQRGGVHRERLMLGLVTGFLGSLLGALLVLRVPNEPLRPLVLVLLLFAALVMLLKERLLRGARTSQRPRTTLALLGACAGFYDGFFGPGTGTLLIAGFVHFFGDTPTRASGNAKIINFGSNLAALMVFQARGAVLWPISLPMGVANVCGAALGARLALRHGDRVVRAVVLLVIVAVAGKIVASIWS